MKRIILSIIFLLALSLACGVGGDISADIPEVDQVATIVAATMSVQVDNSEQAEPLPTALTELGQLPTESTGKATGLRVAYIRDGNIWLWEEGIGSRQLTNTGSASNVKISDDGSLIAFSQQRELWGVSADGGAPIQLVNQAYLASTLHNIDLVGMPNLDSYEFIPGTHALFFDLFMETDSYPIPYGGLHYVDADASAPRQILQDGQSGVRYYSPNQEWVALSQPNHIALMRVDGSNYQVVFDFEAVLTYSEWSFHPEVVWNSTSDGFYLALPAPDFLGNPNESGRFLYIGLAGQFAQLALFHSGPVWNTIPQISPDGTKVLYMKEVGDGREIHIVEASTLDTLFISSPNADVGLLGWADNDHFGFWYGDMNKPWYASLSGRSQQDLTDIYPTSTHPIYWLKDGRLIFKSNQELRVSKPGGSSTLIEASLPFSDFDVAE
ncbi:MAG: hypothetical protein GY755_05855 [Chloroflexi bacterium]|nr:hypothetical protein [Chloroflexota bacterium]